MWEENPVLIQPAPRVGGSNIPLFLIHDGGGTVFSYFLLGEIKRPVYGIHNPKFNSGGKWTGGIDQMARTYCEFVKKTKPEGDVLLGGWSLGGMLSLVMAYKFATDPDLKGPNVLGIIMLDSPCFRNPIPDGMTVVQHPPATQPGTIPEMQAKTATCMDESRRMIEQAGWALTWWSEDLDPSKLPPPPPAVVLLKAREYCKVPAGSPEGAVVRVDVTRKDEVLGWNDWGWEVVKAAWSIGGHHYSIFASKHLETLTFSIRKACDILQMFGKMPEEDRPDAPWDV